MQMSLERGMGYFIDAYEDQKIRSGELWLALPLLISPQEFKELSHFPSPLALKGEEVVQIIPEGIDIILLGTGGVAKFPTNTFMEFCSKRGWAVETMNIGAACRTYNILMSEARNVAALLLT